MKKLRLASFLILSVFVSSGITFLATNFAIAHSGNTNLIHGCIASHGVVNGFIRVIGASNNCVAGEAPLDWNAQGLPGTGVFVNNLVGADFSGIDVVYHNFKGVNLSNSNFKGRGPQSGNSAGSIFRGNELANANLTNTDFTARAIDHQNFSTTATITGLKLIAAGLDHVNFNNKDMTSLDMTSVTFNNSYLSGVNLSGWKMACAPNEYAFPTSINNSDISNSNMSNVDDTNALGCGNDPSFIGSNFKDTNFTGAILKNIDFNNTNLTNANFTNTNLNGATNMSTATITNATWSNTTCPDGTNSNSNDNTCVGHF